MSARDPVIETVREVEDDVDAATPVDAQNASTVVWKSRKKTRDSHSAHIDHLFSEEEETKNRTNQINCPPNRVTPGGEAGKPRARDG
jgi:hypothetical protein